MKAKADKIGRTTVKSVNIIINFTVLTIILLLLAFAGYALWDSDQIYQAADKSRYAVYKPTIEDEGKSFKELQSINPEIIAWLSIYGTNVDYPVTQGKDNMKYVNTSAEGRYSLSGAIFLDSDNNRHFTDFGSLLYGHHMEKKAMFGQIGEFSDREMFDSRQYGNLYFDGKDHGLEFFAFVHTDAYDRKFFNANVREENRQEFLDYLLSKAKYKRDVKITTEDNIILLSTCSSSSTNGRDILVAKITDETYEDPFINIKEEPDRKKEQLYVDRNVSPMRKVPVSSLIAGVVVIEYIIYRIRKRRKENREKRKQSMVK